MNKGLLLVALLVVSFSAGAQYSGPAVESCRALAKREAAREGAQPEDIVLLKDHALLIERYDRKLGSQHVASILTGNGAVVLSGTPTAELSFICLLADEKRPLFFNWLPRQNVSALSQCTRSAELRGKPRACLDALMRIAEVDLTQVYAERFQEANEKGGATLDAFRKANDEWKQYAAAECARRRGLAPQGVSPEDHELGCMVELMRQRARDMREP